MEKYKGMSMEKLLELVKQKDIEIEQKEAEIKQKDEEIEALKKEVEEFKQEQLRELADKGILFKQRRLVLKCTRQQLADKIGISVNTLTNWESGRTVPEFYRLDMVLDAYQLTPEQKLEYLNETIAKAKEKHDENKAKKEAKKEAENNNEEDDE